MGVGTTRGELAEVGGEKSLERQRRQQKEDGRFEAPLVDERKGKATFRNNGGRPGRKPNCVYCSSQEHNSLNCTKVPDVAARRAILQKSGLCWNCTGGGHGVTQCKSRGCKNCNRKHHTSICDQGKSTLDQFHNQRVEKSTSVLMNHASTLHPTVLVKIGK